MKIQALKFLSTTPKRPIQKSDLVLPKETEEDLPAAYLIKWQDLQGLQKYPDRIIDRGRKHKAKGLSSLLLGYDKIPLIKGSFSNTGQLKRSISTLLTNAMEKGERNLYIVAAEDKLFQALWDEAGMDPGEPPKTPKTLLPNFSSQILLDRIPHCEEPTWLAQKYVGNSVEAQLVRQLIIHAAEGKDRVLILGDTGTGKELVARSIHELSGRCGHNFVPVNCGGISKDLFESELFGHKKGAFTSALYDKIGMWQYADHGTLFLDEVGDLSPDHQAKILRALEDNKFRAVGDKKEIEVDARIIAATNRDLFAMVRQGQFREDLYYRLRQFVIRTPSFRDHPEDIPAIAQAVWNKVSDDPKSSLSLDILNLLQLYRWPGNAREVKSVLAYLRALYGKDKLKVDNLKSIFLLQGQMMSDPTIPSSPRERGHRQIESLNHLQKVEEILRATENVFQPLIKNKMTDPQAAESVRDLLQFRLNELEIILKNPSQFPNESIYSEINQTKGNLAYFQGLLQINNSKQAFTYLKKEVTKGLARALTALGREMKQLISSTS
jgi:DNA-binding NtrC family response regulator